MNLHEMRRQYGLHGLNEQDLPADPIVLFSRWFEQALASHTHEANAVVLSTVQGHRPSSRVVLLKDFGARGFVFFSNYRSRKGRELEANPYAALLFYWPELERQVRIEGRVERLSREESEAYFDSRPEGSRLSAIVSPQSSVVESRDALESLTEAFVQSGKPLKIPDYWGGYLLVPDSIEFWQGRPNRLHDRILYKLTDLRSWQISRLAP
ncbi:MAG TPA: pyridoxamine 5'-phosphate oxidase [Bacteroidales bacterium]|nr:pyridoxamine 5'-phosphate oxidase [Bacteroidales bacterium]